MKKIIDSEGHAVAAPTRRDLTDQRKIIAERRANLAGAVARIVADPSKLDNLLYNYDLTLVLALEHVEDETSGIEIRSSKYSYEDLYPGR